MSWPWNKRPRTGGDAELQDEITSHLRMAEQEKLERGATAEAAKHEALREFGNVTLTKEVTRGMWKSRYLDQLGQDIRYAARAIRKAPGFTAVAVLTLGLGIGANTTIFTVLNSLFLNPLPVHNSSELVSVHVAETKDSSRGGTLLPMSYPNFVDFRDRNSVFSAVTAFSSPMAFGLSRDSTQTPQRVFGELVSHNYFEVLGLRPVRGRFFREEEDRVPGTHPVVVLGYGVWQNRFGGSADIVGQTIRLSNRVFTVIGVAPEGFKGVNAVFGPDLWMPLMMADEMVPVELKNALRDRALAAFRVAGRLKNGTSREQAEANLATIAGALAQEYPASNKDRTVKARPITNAALTPDSRGLVLFGSVALMAIVGLILLVACSNIANLLMARAVGRRQEMAVRIALGASKGRLIRQLLTENIVLAVLSGACGVAMAWAGVKLLSAARPAEFSQNLAEPRIDPTVLLFCLALSVLTGMIFGLVPSLAASRTDVVSTLKEESRTVGRSRGKISFANALLVGQVAFSLMALIAAGLFLRNIQKAYAIDPGFETKRMAIVLVSPAQAGYDAARAEEYYRQARDRAAAVPGVVSASWASKLPLFGGLSHHVTIEGQEVREAAKLPMVFFNTVDTGYFATTGISLVKGRDFSDADRQDSVPVAIVNETAASRYWPNQEPLGKRLQLSGEKNFRQVIGVAETVNYESLGEAPLPAVYAPRRQNFTNSLVLYVRTAGDPNPVMSAVQNELRKVDRQVAVDDVRTAGTVINHALWTTKIGVSLSGVFGLLGLGLASIGLYGVMAYSVNLRRREIGLRMALGATSASVMSLILKQGMRVVAIGLFIGLAIAAAAAVFLPQLPLGVSVLDPVTIGIACLTFLIVAAAACYLPARRASRVDPMVALHDS